MSQHNSQVVLSFFNYYCAHLHLSDVCKKVITAAVTKGFFKVYTLTNYGPLFIHRCVCFSIVR